MEPVLQYHKITNQAIVPTKATVHAAGHDLYSAYDYIIPAGKSILVKTDLQMQFPEGTYGRIAPRSGLALNENVHVGGGVIDRDYTGNIGAILFNLSSKDYHISRGDRIAQVICENILYPTLRECAEKMPATPRGEKGFGSSGK